MWSKSSIRSVSDVFFIYVQYGDSHCVNRLDQPQLKYVIQGEMSVFDGKQEIKVRGGESIFLRKDHQIRIHKYPLAEEEFKCITFVFTRNFLRHYFHHLVADIGYKYKAAVKFDVSYIKLTDILPVRSLFLSMLPYYEADEMPSPEIMHLKMCEAVQILLLTDERFYPTLFDFADAWKIDIVDYLNENYMYTLTLAEIANYTGRSLSTFKRDFARISELTPEKWIMNKRLDKAYELLMAGLGSVTQVMTAVGFKNSSHFSTIFKKKFKVTPSEVIKNIKR